MKKDIFSFSLSEDYLIKEQNELMLNLLILTFL